jgi:CPA1 family monovalent cation:H+ antiporter
MVSSVVPPLYLTLGFLATAALVSAVAARARLPYTVALVVVGLAAGTAHLVPPIAVRPDVIVTALILPLLFEGAVRIPRRHLRTYAPLIVALAVPGTVVSAAAIAGAALLGHVPWRAALLLGAVCAATDPAGVIALVREAALDERLGTVLEGEAVVNDAVAIVLFGLAMASPPDVGPAAASFVWLLAGGAAAGFAVGAAAAYMLRGIADPVVEAIGSLVAAVAAYVVSETVRASGVIGVVAAGLAFAELAGRSLTPAGSETVRVVWDVIAFLANSALFLLVGLVVPLPLLARYGGLIAVVVLAALASRALIVYGFTALLARGAGPFPTVWRHLMVWGGLRGGVAVALVLALPPMLPQREAVAAGILGTVVWTLVGQGLLMRPIMLLLGLDRAVPHEPRPAPNEAR